MRSDLLKEANHAPNEFWKTIGKVGINTKRHMPMEVVLGEGSISRNNRSKKISNDQEPI